MRTQFSSCINSSTQVTARKKQLTSFNKGFEAKVQCERNECTLVYFKSAGIHPLIVAMQWMCRRRCKLRHFISCLRRQTIPISMLARATNMRTKSIKLIDSGLSRDWRLTTGHASNVWNTVNRQFITKSMHGTEEAEQLQNKSDRMCCARRLRKQFATTCQSFSLRTPKWFGSN